MIGCGLLTMFGQRKQPSAGARPTTPAEAPAAASQPQPRQCTPPKPSSEWPPERIDVNDTLWGAGYIFPGGELETLRLAKAMQLSGETSVLLLGAGSGGAGCVLSIKFGSWVAGMEADADLAVAATERAMKANMSRRVQTEAWNPAQPEFKKRFYNHCIAIEPLRGARPEPMLTALGDGLKAGGHLAMLELVADTPLDPSDPLVGKWAKLEHRSAGGLPTELSITRVLGRLGFDVRIAEDNTERHMHDALIGWRRTLREIEAKKHSLRQIAQFVNEAELWLLRLRLMEKQKLRLVRWHAIGR
mgnify:CR=1 FL=1|jgi:cyclopropane fatty-acyl-phospholipid synthase-like methyltransferase